MIAISALVSMVNIVYTHSRLALESLDYTHCSAEASDSSTASTAATSPKKKKKRKKKKAVRAFIMSYLD